MDKTSSNAVDLRSVIQFMKRRGAYAHQPDTVEHIQTHISHVFMVPPYVYKLKKRVDFGFLDYSTLEKRKAFCEKEVELNRRLCSDIYLGVVPIFLSDGQLKLGSVDESAREDDIVEYAVKMKMLDEQYFLHTFIDNHELTEKHLDRVVDTLTPFYREQQPDKRVKEYGNIERIRFNTDENFGQTEEFIGDTISRLAYNAIRRYTNEYLDEKKALFERRVQENKIVNGHGDLHLEHIHVSPAGVCIYDCIEFSERLRCGDQAADLAFFAMDLDYNHEWKLSRYFIDQMAEALGDEDLTEIIDFYKCYRAYVKGKVKSLKSAEEEVDAKDREEAKEIASVYFNLALRYALLGSTPTVLMCMGRIGTGKSTIADWLSKSLGLKVYSSDRIRKEMAGLPLNERTPADTRTEIYSPEMSQRTYEELLSMGEAEIAAGKSVILDATFSKEADRQEITSRFQKHGIRYLFVEAVAPDDVIKERLKKREYDTECVSDARLEDFNMLTESYDAPDELASKQLIRVGTDQEMDQTEEELCNHLIDHQLSDGG